MIVAITKVVLFVLCVLCCGGGGYAYAEHDKVSHKKEDEESGNWLFVIGMALGALAVCL